MNWNLLGIEPTTDKKAITAAYRAKLVQVNPEDKPEEFMALRAAYEAALQYAEQESAPARAETPVEAWVRRLRRLYDHFPSRCSAECWEEFLSDPVCTAPDTRPAAEEAVLRFLMEDFYIPRFAWQLLDKVFHLTERKDELCEVYPQDFIEFAVLNGIHMDPALPCELFAPGENARDCDAYRRLYHQLLNTPPDGREPVIAQMRVLSESHPYGEALICLHQIQCGDAESGFAGIQSLALAHPGDVQLNMYLAHQYFNRNLVSEALSLAQKITELAPTHRQARILTARCLAAREEYDEAKEILFALQREAGGDMVVVKPIMELMQQWNLDIIRKGEELLASCPGNSENARKLTWCYIQNQDLENAERASRFVDPEKELPFDYHNLMGKLLHSLNRKEEALPHFEAVELLLAEAQNDPDHPAAEHVDRLSEFLQLSGDCLLFLEREAEAYQKFERSLELSPEDITILDSMGRFFYSRKEYGRAVDIFRRLTVLQPDSHYPYLMLSVNYYELGRDQEAFDAINYALSIQGADLSAYVVKMRILLRNGAWKDVREILEFLESNGVPKDSMLRWFHAQLLEYEQEDNEQALDEYRKIASDVEQGDAFPWVDELYYHIAVLTAPSLDMNSAEDRQKLLDILERGLKHNADHEDCLDYKAWVLKRSGNTQEALKIYKEMEARPGHSLNAEQGLADIYFENLERSADEALHYFRILLQHRDNPALHYYVATCLRFMGDLDAAEHHYRQELELDPTDVDGYNGLSKIYKAQGRSEEALEQLNLAIAAVAGQERNFTWLYNQKTILLRRMGMVREALETQHEAIKRYDSKRAYETCFDICCQFGMWDHAKKMLDAWVKACGSSETTAVASVMLQLYQGKMMKATLAFASGVKLIKEYETDTLKMEVANLEGNPERALRVWSKRMGKSPENTNVLGNLAHVQWLTGHREDAVATAGKALCLIDRKLTGFLVDEALYRSQRIRVLAILGRAEEAREELKKVRSLPLCEHCTYGSCKDADIYEAEIEEILGNREKAMELFRKGAEKWPDDLDFAAGIARLKKKGT